MYELKGILPVSYTHLHFWPETAINISTESQAKSDSYEVQSLVKKCLCILKRAAPEAFSAICDSIKTNNELYLLTTSVIET